jgi:hypothetical protein
LSGVCAFFAWSDAGCASVTQVPVRPSEPRQYLLLPVEINGAETTFLMDTGTTQTVIAGAFADRIGIRVSLPAREIPVEIGGPGASQLGRAATLKSFRIGSKSVNREARHVVIGELPAVLSQFGPDISGLAGNSLWSSIDYVLDAKLPSLFISRDLGLSKSGLAGHLKTRDGATYLPVEVEGHSFDFRLDTGANASRVTQELIDALRSVNYDYLELEISTGDSVEYKRFPALHAETRVGQVHIPQFTFLIGEENVIGLNLLKYGELSLSARTGLFVFRGWRVP